jgi:hypothetical protein
MGWSLVLPNLTSLGRTVRVPDSPIGVLVVMLRRNVRRTAVLVVVLVFQQQGFV